MSARERHKDDEQPATVRVAYHAGPPAIGFYGRNWGKGEAQAVTPQEWTAMQQRADFNDFDFRVEE